MCWWEYVSAASRLPHNPYIHVGSYSHIANFPQALWLQSNNLKKIQMKIKHNNTFIILGYGGPRMQAGLGWAVHLLLRGLDQVLLWFQQTELSQRPTVTMISDFTAWKDDLPHAILKRMTKPVQIWGKGHRRPHLWNNSWPFLLWHIRPSLPPALQFYQKSRRWDTSNPVNAKKLPRPEGAAKFIPT